MHAQVHMLRARQLEGDPSYAQVAVQQDVAAAKLHGAGFEPMKHSATLLPASNGASVQVVQSSNATQSAFGRLLWHLHLQATKSACTLAPLKRASLQHHFSRAAWNLPASLLLSWKALVQDLQKHRTMCQQLTRQTSAHDVCLMKIATGHAACRT